GITPRALYDALRERRIELGFTRLYGAVPEDDLHQEALFEDRLVVVAGVHSPWTRRRKITLAELLHEPWTWPSVGTNFNALIAEAFRRSGLEPPRATVYVEDVNARIMLAAIGSVLAVVTAVNLKFSARDALIKELPVVLPISHRLIGVITLKNRTLSPLAQLFIEHSREVSEALAKRR